MTSTPTTSSKKLIFVGLLIALAAGGAGYRYYRGQGSKVTYRPITLKRGEMRIKILSTGVVQPENRVDIKPPIAGRVERVLVNEGDRVKKGQVLAWMSSTERAALLDAASARGEEELKQWEELYRATPILAPISGTVIARNVESGQTFTVSDAILTMSDRLTVKAQVDETDIAEIKLKQQASIVLDAYSRETINAIVDQIAYDAKTVNNVTTYVVDVLPKQTPKFMRSGMTANVTFEVASKADVLIVSAEAVRVRDGVSYVLVPGPGGSGQVEREIETGLSDGKRIEIVSGLEEGATILIPDFKMGERKQAGGSPFSPMGGGRGGGRGGH